MEVKTESKTANILWLFYPVFLLGLKFITTPKSWTNVSEAASFNLGGAFVIFILTLIVFGIRSLFRKTKLLPLRKALFFYITSLIITMIFYLGIIF
jgi:hypothetical protein